MAYMDDPGDLPPFDGFRRARNRPSPSPESGAAGIGRAISSENEIPNRQNKRIASAAWILNELLADISSVGSNAPYERIDETSPVNVQYTCRMSPLYGASGLLTYRSGWFVGALYGGTLR